MTTALLYPIEATTSTVAVRPTVLSGQLPGPPSGMPASVPRAQLYYWSERWQADEAESLAEYEAGEGRHFESAQEAIRWLLSGDD